jgi:hypothetical protein
VDIPLEINDCLKVLIIAGGPDIKNEASGLLVLKIFAISSIPSVSW